jgi:hypothetical protein
VFSDVAVEVEFAYANQPAVAVCGERSGRYPSLDGRHRAAEPVSDLRQGEELRSHGFRLRGLAVEPMKRSPRPLVLFVIEEHRRPEGVHLRDVSIFGRFETLGVVVIPVFLRVL